MEQKYVNVGVLLRPVVYALLLHGEVVYIGKAMNGLTRLYTHQYNWRRYQQGKRLHFGRAMEFDGICVWPSDAKHLSALEAEMIEQYKPKHNTQLKRPGKVTVPIVLTLGKTKFVLNRAPSAPFALERRL
jgi:excinuclease UvrABC nuclease subunit